MRRLVQILALIAVMLMPLGMTAPTAHAAMPRMAHCPEHHHPANAVGECTMACSAALPAADSVADATLPSPRPLIIASLILTLHGVHPDTATPPPRIA
jgi:hypothetical protein